MDGSCRDRVGEPPGGGGMQVDWFCLSFTYWLLVSFYRFDSSSRIEGRALPIFQVPVSRSLGFRDANKGKSQINVFHGFPAFSNGWRFHFPLAFMRFIEIERSFPNDLKLLNTILSENDYRYKDIGNALENFFCSFQTSPWRSEEVAFVLLIGWCRSLMVW